MPELAQGMGRAMARGPTQQASVGEGISASTGGVAPAGSSLATHSPKSKAQAEASPGEAQAACSRSVHTAPQHPWTGSALQAQPQTDRSISTFSS